VAHLIRHPLLMELSRVLNSNRLRAATCLLSVSVACIIPCSAAEVQLDQATIGTSTPLEVAAGPVVIDNDTDDVSAASPAESLPISAEREFSIGTKFPIQILSAHFSKSAVSGDPVEAALGADINLGGQLVAPKGSKVVGQVTTCEHSSKFAKSLNSKRKLRMSASVGLQFDTIVTPTGLRIPINARPSQQARFVENKSTGRILGVTSEGNIAPPMSSQVKAQAFTMAIRAGASAAGPMSFGAVPVAFGIMGAIAPSIFLLRPVGANERHRRLKGFGLGLLNGVPGGFVVADCFVNGGEVAVLPGDQLMAEFRQPFSGIESTVSETVAIEPAKEVHGQVLRDN
jgi:hypothetical protein